MMDNQHDLTVYFANLIEQHRSIDLAEDEFKRQISEDVELRSQYREWCEEYGHSLRNGFADFAEEYLENRESVWDSLTDYDDHE